MRLRLLKKGQHPLAKRKMALPRKKRKRRNHSLLKVDLERRLLEVVEKPLPPRMLVNLFRQ